jgi:hypothetical protein
MDWISCEHLNFTNNKLVLKIQIFHIAGIVECHSTSNRLPFLEKESRQAIVCGQKYSAAGNCANNGCKYKMCNLCSTAITSIPHEMFTHILLFLFERKFYG